MIKINKAKININKKYSAKLNIILIFKNKIRI